MLARIRTVAVVTVLTAAIALIGLQTARADSKELSVEKCNELLRYPNEIKESVKQKCEEKLKKAKASSSQSLRATAVAVPIASVRRLLNVDATLQSGEPTAGGLMTRTEWIGFKAPAAERIVINTFGSELWEGSGVFDTLLGVYRGTFFDNFTRVAFNDNTLVLGISSRHSLVQFNTTANSEYRVQVGSRNQAEGVFSLNMFRFPPSGGLAAFLIQTGGIAFKSADYSCVDSVTCPSAKFIVYNATDKTLNVTPSTTLGAGVVSPAAFSLDRGTLKVVEFKFGSSFSKAVRTQVGNFVFTGRIGASVVTQATTRALIVVRPNARTEDMITAVVSPTIQTGQINEPLTFTAKVVNTSATTAIGCHFRSTEGSYLHTSFYDFNPANGRRQHADDTPVNIAAGGSRSFKVTVASQGTYDADFIDPEVIADCANNFKRTQPLRGGFDISATAYTPTLPSLAVTASAPSNGVLSVPGSGYAYFKFRATNTQTTRILDALPAYVGPFDDPANSQYTVAICRTNLSTGACIGKYARSVTYTATKGTIFGFSVRVKAPTGNPAYDPDKRRVLVNFKLTNAPYLHIAVPSIAVRKH